MQPIEWQRVEKPDFGYAVRIPSGWEVRPPNLKDSPWETRASTTRPTAGTRRPCSATR
ncbi:hypothetical protein Atai01_82700 [Amycolatopsis taiwanensis]|uniref:Uncharacterized protein n=1 Tax=Amycolatopsis taiwanensis TaxID=342230 RepID=A0A9W6R966_9PSEU|nr:hypothetical protein Atai01_82700 [Amycolatopsis taiwanensis]